MFFKAEQVSQEKKLMFALLQKTLGLSLTHPRAYM